MSGHSHISNYSLILVRSSLRSSSHPTMALWQIRSFWLLPNANELQSVINRPKISWRGWRIKQRILISFDEQRKSYFSRQLKGLCTKLSSSLFRSFSLFLPFFSDLPGFKPTEAFNAETFPSFYANPLFSNPSFVFLFTRSAPCVSFQFSFLGFVATYVWPFRVSH